MFNLQKLEASALFIQGTQTHFLHRTASPIKSEVNRPSYLAGKALAALVKDDLFHLLVVRAGFDASLCLLNLQCVQRI